MAAMNPALPLLLVVLGAVAGCTREPASVPDADAAPGAGPSQTDGAPVEVAPAPAGPPQQKASVDGHFLVTLAPDVVPVPMNRIHAWTVTVTTPDGVPVTGARVSFDGGMPDHDHGFPTRPRVQGEVDAGRYRIDGIKFSMSGWWRMELGIAAGDRIDAVAFDLDVAP